MKRAVIYTRVSTDEQAAEGYSLQTQLAGCRRYAADNVFSIAAELADDCSGTLEFVDRPQGRFIIEMANRGEIDAVILYTLDRTARDENVTEYLFLKASLHDLDIELHFSDTGLDEWGLAGNIIGFIKASMASDERLKIIERTMRGRVAKANAKIPVMTGIPPFGYKREGKGKDAKMFIYEPQAQAVKLIFDWYVNGNGGQIPLGLYTIAKKLDEANIQTPDYRKNKAKYWSQATVFRILNNPIYCGTTYYGKWKTVGKKKKKHRILQPVEKRIEIPVPQLAIISRSLYDAAQDKAKRNLEQSRRNQKNEYLLSGHFRCGTCNSVMYGCYTQTNGKKYYFYRCGNHYYQHKDAGCSNINKFIHLPKAETTIWDWVSGLILDDATLLSGLHKIEEKWEKESAPRQERLRFVIGELETTGNRIYRLVNSLADEEDGTLADAIKAQLKVYTAQKDSFEEERKNIESELAKQSVSAEFEHRILERVHNIRHKMANPTFEQKREVLDGINVRVIFYDDDEGRRLWATCGIKPEGDVITLPSSPRWWERP
jgi:site-specific DNA recombinase